MKIIGHRGAAGLALENTTAAIVAAKKAGVDAVEFDVRCTADGTLVLCHDNNTARICEASLSISKSTLKELKKLTLTNNQTIPTLAEAVEAANGTPVVIEPKGSHWAKPLADFLDSYPPIDARIIAFNHRELGVFAKLCPAIPAYALEQTKPFDVIQLAKQSGFAGVDMNFWILNPLTYWLARRRKLNIIVYTVNRRWIALFLNVLFPRIAITTDRPDMMQFLRPRHKRLSQTTSEVPVQ